MARAGSWECGGEYLFGVFFVFRHFVGNFRRECFVENLAEFDRLFSNINCVDEVFDEAFQARGAGRKKVNLIINELRGCLLGRFRDNPSGLNNPGNRMRFVKCK